MPAPELAQFMKELGATAELNAVARQSSSRALSREKTMPEVARRQLGQRRRSHDYRVLN
jgi:hypothetical protein